MELFTFHKGIGAPLRRSDVDTDQIIPAVYLKRINRTGLEDGLFATWRTVPSFVLNIEPYDKGSVLVAGPEFGTGSSREHAVWALMDFGFRVVIAPRFADIFRDNAANTGLLAAQMAQPDVELLWDLLDDQPGLELSVDLRVRTVGAGTALLPFEIDDYTRWRLLEGLDHIAVTMRDLPAVTGTKPPGPWMPSTLAPPVATCESDLDGSRDRGELAQTSPSTRR